VFSDRVNHRPIIKDNPKNATIIVGDSVEFTCQVISDLHKHITWIHKDTNKKLEVKVSIQHAQL
jgi:hypothetical protein